MAPYSNSFVSQSGWWCPALRMSPNSFFFPYCNSFLPVWLVVSGSPDVSNSFVSPYINSFVSQSGWWCPALRMSPIHLSPLIAIHFVSQSGWWCPALRMSPIHLSPLTAIHLSPSLAGGVRLSGCLQFIRLRLQQVSLVVSGSLQFSNSCISPSSNAFVSHSCW